MLVGVSTANSIFLWPDNTVDITFGIPVGVKVDSLLMRFQDIGPLLTGEWWFATAGAGFKVAVLETIFGQNIVPNLMEG